MKTKHRLLHALAAAFVGQIIVIADTPPSVPPPPAPPADIDLPVHAARKQVESVERHLRSAEAQLHQQLAEADRAVQMAQTAVRRAVIGGEPPPPPDAPEPPEDLLGQEIEHSIQLWDTTTGSPFGPGGLMGAGSGGELLIVPEGEAQPEMLAEAREDLAIFSRIVRKAAGRTDDQAVAMGIMLSSLPALRQPQAMYLGGYGAVFLLNVQFPLAPTAEVEKKPADRPANTAWEEARRELYGAKQSPGVAWVGKPGPRREAAYDAERVERLKRELTDALKNASNLRHLKDEEQVVVTVTSGAASGSLQHELYVVHLEREGRYGTGSAGSKPKIAARESGSRGGPGTTMVLRVKKADATAFAAGKLDREAFAQKVAITSY